MSDRKSPVTLDFIVQQQEKIITEQADFRADFSVLLALIQRLDGTVQGLTGEVRALHGQIDRFRHRMDRQGAVLESIAAKLGVQGQRNQ